MRGPSAEQPPKIRQFGGWTRPAFRTTAAATDTRQRECGSAPRTASRTTIGAPIAPEGRPRRRRAASAGPCRRTGPPPRGSRRAGMPLAGDFHNRLEAFSGVEKTHRAGAGSGPARQGARRQRIASCRRRRAARSASATTSPCSTVGPPRPWRPVPGARRGASATRSAGSAISGPRDSSPLLGACTRTAALFSVGG